MSSSPNRTLAEGCSRKELYGRIADGLRVIDFSDMPMSSLLMMTALVEGAPTIEDRPTRHLQIVGPEPTAVTR